MTADNPEPNATPDPPGRTRPRAAAWVAVPLGSLNVAFSLLSLLLAGLAGWSLSRYLEGYTLPSAFFAVSYSVVGALIASHRPRNPLGWIFLAVGFSQGFDPFAEAYANYALITDPGSSLPDGALMSWLSYFTWLPGLSLAITCVPLLFPDGGLPSRRWRAVAWLSTGPLAIFVVLQVYLWPYRGQIPPPKLSGLIGALSDLLGPLMLVCAIACVSSLMFRYRRAAGRERQQVKWFAYAAASFLTAFVASVYLPFGPIIYVPLLPAVLLVPVAMGIAILRYRLYDIDVIIYRTLVYGTLTVTLVAVYFGAIVLLEGVGSVVLQVPVHALTGQEEQSQLAVMISTLASAALFNPLRQRIQGFIDRRFYRRKYDAAKTLETFSAKLRDETDLDALSDDLVGVVRETMQPTDVSLWLHPDPALTDKKKRADIRESGPHD